MQEAQQRHFFSYSVQKLLLLNVCLQAFDGVATYQGLQLGWQEGNPLLRSLMTYWGVEWTLVAFKIKACALLMLLHRVRRRLLSAAALAFAAFCYLLFSFLPWLLCLFLFSPD